MPATRSRHRSTSRSPERAKLVRRREAPDVSPGGFTLIEILVVILIMGILIALAIPAVQQAREASRRARCLSNLRQIGIAVHSYVSSIGSFPCSGRYSWNVLILPFLESRTFYDGLNFSVSGDVVGQGSPNQTVAESTIDLFLCPSVRPPATRLGRTDYCGNAGFYDRRLALGAYLDGNRNGVLCARGALGPGDVTDGASVTLMASEWVPGSGSPDLRDRLGSVFATRSDLVGPEGLDLFVATCRAVDPSTADLAAIDKGLNWLHPGLMRDSYNHVITPNEPSCIPGGLTQEGAYGAASRHPGGVGALFADGHSRFIRNQISSSVWRAIGTRNGQEVVDASSF